MDKETLLKGLTDSEVAESKSKFGDNSLSKQEPESIFQMLLDSFKDICIIVLCAALGVKVLITILGMVLPAVAGENDWIEIISIIIAILLSTGFSTISEYRNTSRSDALQEEYNKSYAKVVRNGKLVSILTSDIVKGDIILVQAGDKVPADGLVVGGKIKVSQASLNGESRDEDKWETDNMSEAESTDYGSNHKVFMGSVVTHGEAYIKVTVVGDASELGKINKALTDNDEEERKDTSSLKLEVIVGQIGKLGTFCAVLAGVLQVVLGITRADSSVINANFIIMLVCEGVVLGASILIMAIPEGLPMMTSLVQSMNTESLYKHNILVSHKAAFSDSAYINTLFSDKTGTITNGDLTLEEFIIGNGEVVTSIDSDKFLDSIVLNNIAKVSEGKAIGSNNMDRALLKYAMSKGVSNPKTSMSEVKEISGFDSEKKCATATFVDGSYYWKGATENIIDRVTHYLDNKGNEICFTAEDREALNDAMVAMAKRTMKLLTTAKVSADEKKVVLYAVLCLRDNVRKDVVETVNTLNSAGIQVVMVTGDAEDTAVAIAKEAGIVTGDDNVIITHDQLEAMSDDEIKEILPRLRVISRAKPLDKKRIVSIAQSLDHVCGMTGDGVNDAPALKQADVGFAMGDGTAVAQEAGDVVILNNSLTSIKDCVLNSRTMARSIGKFLIFQLTVNVSTLLMNILAPILGWTEPFSIVQILWINLIMDTLAAMAFGGEPILDRYMLEPPAKRTDKILTHYIKSAIGVAAVFITLGSIVILENVFGILDMVRPVGLTDYGVFDRTFMFAFFIYAIIFNSLNTRSERFNLFEHISENKRFVAVMGAIFVMQTVLIEIGGSVFGTTPLSLKALGISMILGFLIIPVDFIRKLIIGSDK